jgi:hypothetical protein
MPKSDFECVICGDGKFEALPRWVDDDSRICDECAEECVAPRFHKALEHEHHYPVMFGKIVLDIWTFWDLFDGDFLTAWAKKLQEYDVPVKSRMYCEQRGGVDGDVCGAYLGTRGFGSVCCSVCHCSTCRKCGASSSTKTHHCQEVMKEDPFEKMSKGQDYQQCPGCKKEIFQGEGCNHMVCHPPCSTHFCFICGKQVIARRSGHWQKGGCARFGVKGKTLLWDNYGEHSDAGSEDEGDLEFDTGDFDTNDEADAPAPDFDQRIELERLIEIFDHVRDAEELDDTRARYRATMTPTPRRESRADFYSYISVNLALVNEVGQVGFDLDDAADILREFRNRHRHIIHELHRFQVEPGYTGHRVTNLADLEDELASYRFYAGDTMGNLQQIVRQETGRAAPRHLGRGFWP